MPLSKTQLSILKRALRTAPPGTRLPEPVLVATAAEAGLTLERVKQWVRDVRRYYKPDEKLDEFLSLERSAGPSSITKQMFLVAWVSEAKLDAFLSSSALGVEYVECARCNQTGETEIYIRYSKQVVISTTLRCLKKAGFSSISWHTYSNDNNDQAARSLLRLKELSQKDGYTHRVFGSRSKQLVSKVKTVLKKKFLEGLVSDENDVVKKRKQMDKAESSVEDTFTTEGFAHFLAFERNTKMALLRAIQDDDVKTRTLELELTGSTATSGTGSKGTQGGVYVAKSADIDAFKIGATLRSDPQLRLNELSRLVSVPFLLMLWIPSTKPFKLERAVHKFFDEFRVRIPNVSTEFFTIEEQDVKDYFETRKRQKLERQR